MKLRALLGFPVLFSPSGGSKESYFEGRLRVFALFFWYQAQRSSSWSCRTCAPPRRRMRACSWSRSTTGCSPCATRDPTDGDKARIFPTLFLSSSISDVAMPSSVRKSRRRFSSCSSSRKQESQAATRCFSFDWLRRRALRRFDCQAIMPSLRSP